MRKLKSHLRFFLALLFLGLLGGCGSTGTGTSFVGSSSTSSAGGSTSQKTNTDVIGRLEAPNPSPSTDALFRATWDSRTVVIDIRDQNGILPVGANVMAKIRVAGDDNDHFEDEDDNDNSEHTGNDGRPVTLNATYDADSRVYVLQLPASVNLTDKQKLKIKVTATGYKTANGKIKFTLNGSTPSYVGVFLRKKNGGGGSSSIALDSMTSLAVTPASGTTIQPGGSVRLKVTGTLSDNSTVIDPPTAVSISPSGAQVSIDATGTYQFTGVTPGSYTVTFSLGAVTATSTVTVAAPPDPPIVGFRTGSADSWANNVAGFLSHIDNVNGGFYDGGWNVAFATVESSAAQGGIGNPAFGQGVVIGNASSLYLYLTDGIWATTYLQAAGGSPGPLTATQGNGVTTTSSGDFGHQVLALKFNVDFSNPPAGSNVSAGYYLPTGFGSLRLKSTGTGLDGSSISDVLAAANLALSGGALPQGYTYASLNALVTNLNGSFIGGTSSAWANGHLVKPVGPTSYRLYVGNFATTSITEYSIPANFTPGSTLDLSPTCSAIIDTGFSNSPCGLSFNPLQPDQVFVTDENAWAVKEYNMPLNGPSPATNADGTSQTLNILNGPDSGMYNPQGIATDGLNLYVGSVSGRYITVTPLNWTVGQAPSRTIQLPPEVYGVPVGLAVDTKNKVLVAAIGADGSPNSSDCVAVFDLNTYALVQSFKGPNCHFSFPRGIAVDNTVTPAQIFACNANPDGAGVWTMSVFQLDRNATTTDVTPLYLVSGPNLHLVASSAASVTEDGKYLAVANSMWSVVNLFDLASLRSNPANSVVDLAPVLSITGPNSLIASPNGMAIK